MAILLLFVTACGATRTGGERTTNDGSATIVRGTELGGNLLESLRGRVPSMTISYASGDCPHIEFRGMRSARFQGNPDVYVDGARMLDTCILTQIGSNDIDYVEVYPSGHTNRPGIQRSPFGLILVFRVKE
jgi:hypothetical protein